MNRLKLLATATLVALTLTACDEGTPPPVEPDPPATPVGTISGSVTIEGTAAAGVTATLSSGATTTTGSGGNFAFSGVEAGTYTVTISGFPEDATFAQATQSATIATDGENVQLTFAGEYVRSSAVVGAVVAADAVMSGGDGQPETLGGVTVTLEGEHASETAETDANGGFSFPGLRAGAYVVTISGFPEDVSFETSSLEVEVGVGEVGNADFTGHFIRTSAVEGRVAIEGEGLAGVTVTLAGGPSEESHTTTTDADGAYRFEELRPGDYVVSISDFDARDYEFASTSQDVSVDLGETDTVSFTGVLLRTSGISGRVSVDGMGLADVEVALSGVEERSATTDAGGQYAFAGLAAGDYVVSITVEGNAYVFEVTSEDVELGDNVSEIVNFEGAHATTSSVSGFAFLDESAKNDEFDEGEGVLAHAGIPVVLVGPTVANRELGMTDAEGRFSFEGLRAGRYELAVPVDAAVAADLAANDVAYGGGLSYPIELGVDEEASVAIPFDITHTTVSFTVSLRHGDDVGEAVPGATVSLYADAAGESRIGSGDTGDDGSAASIRVARAGVANHTVHAAVSADGYHVAAGMTEVTWDAGAFAVAAGNDNDVVNLAVNVMVSGATVDRGEYGGGDALANWAIGVTSGGAAVAGAPTALDADGSAVFETTVAADDLPASFAFAVAADQDDGLDGGESYEGTAVEHAHTGLALARRVDAGAMEVRYTTQKLMVYVHNELDQVHGYTGNLLGGDVRDDGKVTIGIRHIDGTGRSRPVEGAKTSSADGVWTFSNLSADLNVIVQATVNADAGVRLLGVDELAAYTGREVNGIEGGAFGANGGSSHTVSLCPLRATAPAGQDHGECSTFAYVTTHTVSGLVWKRNVEKDPASDGFVMSDPAFVPGLTVSLSPVEGKNLADDGRSETTEEKDNAQTADIDETHEFSWSGVAAGAYTFHVPDGWRANKGGKNAGDADGAMSPGGDLDPLKADLAIDVTPATGLVYGRVTDSDGFAAPNVTVEANGRSTTSDALGRYIIDGIGPESRKVGDDDLTNRIFVETNHSGNVRTLDHAAFKANTPMLVNVSLSGVGLTASVSGTVRASTTNAPVAGVEIRIDGGEPQGGKLLTGADGTYTAIFEAKDPGQSVSVSASKAGMSFVPGTVLAPAHPGSAATGFDFTGFPHATISGTVVAPAGGPMEDVVVTATSTTDGSMAYSDTTGVTGTYSISVPFGAYTMSAATADPAISFDLPSRGTANVAPGTNFPFPEIRAKTFGATIGSAMRVDSANAYIGGLVRFSAKKGDVPDGYADATYAVETNTGADGAWEAPATDRGTVTSDSTVSWRNSDAKFDGAFAVRIVATAVNSTTNDTVTSTSDTLAVAAIDPAASNVAAGRGGNGDSLVVSWEATTSARSEFRVLVAFDGDDAMYVAATLTSRPRSWGLDVSAMNANTSWNAAEGSGSKANVKAELDKALSIQVQSRQGSTGDWSSSEAATDTVAAKP